MEPITTTILAALAAGAAAAAKDTAGSAIKDAYQGLKSLIQKRFEARPDAEKAQPVSPEQVLAAHEKEPETWKKPLEQALTAAEAEKDEKIVQQAQALLDLLAKAKQGGATTINVTGDGSAATQGGVAAGKGGIAAGGNVNVGTWGTRDEK